MSKIATRAKLLALDTDETGMHFHARLRLIDDHPNGKDKAGAVVYTTRLLRINIDRGGRVSQLETLNSFYEMEP